MRACLDSRIDIPLLQFGSAAGGGGFRFGAAESALGNARVVAQLLERGLNFFYLLAVSALSSQVGDAISVFGGIVPEYKQRNQGIGVQLPK
jgi:hypothetical protein